MRTERIVFQKWTADDLRLALAIWGDPRVTRLVADLGNPSEEQAVERLEREIANQEKYGVQYWPIFLHSGEHLGCCGLRPYHPTVFEIGAHILPQHWGQGYATEALQCVVAFAFDTLRATALFARHNPHNHGSGRIVLKLGFRYTHDEYMQQTGLNHPCYLLTEQDRGRCYPV
ncbi:MAG: GNAT family N-acetyltransferase [Planctomycetes bacterium]|nr:GNAT family N-acetyltransferase [Planctomycetota bacterium]